jgi:ribonuclease HI
MRDVNGYWIWGYSMYIGNTTSTQAELWAVRQGLSKLGTWGHRHII